MIIYVIDMFKCQFGSEYKCYYRYDSDSAESINFIDITVICDMFILCFIP